MTRGKVHQFAGDRIAAPGMIENARCEFTFSGKVVSMVIHSVSQQLLQLRNVS